MYSIDNKKCNLPCPSRPCGDRPCPACRPPARPSVPRLSLRGEHSAGVSAKYLYLYFSWIKEKWRREKGRNVKLKHTVTNLIQDIFTTIKVLQYLLMPYMRLHTLRWLCKYRAFLLDQMKNPRWIISILIKFLTTKLQNTTYPVWSPPSPQEYTWVNGEWPLRLNDKTRNDIRDSTKSTQNETYAESLYLNSINNKWHPYSTYLRVGVWDCLSAHFAFLIVQYRVSTEDIGMVFAWYRSIDQCSYTLKLEYETE